MPIPDDLNDLLDNDDVDEIFTLEEEIAAGSFGTVYQVGPYHDLLAHHHVGGGVLIRSYCLWPDLQLHLFRALISQLVTPWPSKSSHPMKTRFLKT
jgi:hypothetical protein